jgi:hypothetical protein
LQTALTIGVPVVVILIGMLLNRQDANRLDAKIDSLRHNIEGKIDGLRSDMREFYRTLGQHEARLDNLEK